ncbi:MAG: roadblock/LC7 domain-containing protein, partial [Candidatus Hodarchaeota archaeon]
MELDDFQKRRDRNLFGDNPDIQGLMLLTKEGLPLYSELTKETNNNFVAAISATIVNISKGAVKEFARGDLKRILIEGVEGIIILSKAGPKYILCTVTKSNANLDMVSLSIQQITNKLLAADFDDK